MPSAHEKARLAKKKEAAKKKGGKKREDEVVEDESANGSKEGSATPGGKNGVDLSSLTTEEKLVHALEEEARNATEARACTGVLGIHPLARDIKIDNFSVTFYGAELLQDTRLELSVGNRWEPGAGPRPCSWCCTLLVKYW